jgi:transposase-like protein
MSGIFDRRFFRTRYLAIFTDGNYFTKKERVIAIGVTLFGKKIVLGFAEKSTENHTIYGNFLNELKGCGLRLK